MKVNRGYDSDWVQGITHEALESLGLLCDICPDIPRDPVKTRTSNKIFCRACLEDFPFDPIGDYELGMGDYLAIDSIRLNQIMNLNLGCPNKECDWTGPLSIFDLHVAGCPVGGVLCEFCDFRTERRYLDSHMQSQHHECECGERMKQDEWVNHIESSCPEIDVKCLFDFCSFRPKRKDLDVHINEDHSPSSIVRYFEDKMRKMDEKFDRIKEDLVTKSLEFDRVKEDLVTKSLEFDRVKEDLVTKSLEFDRVKEDLITKSLEFDRVKEELATKSRELANIRKPELIITAHAPVIPMDDTFRVRYFKCFKNSAGKIKIVSLSSRGSDGSLGSICTWDIESKIWKSPVLDKFFITKSGWGSVIYVKIGTLLDDQFRIPISFHDHEGKIGKGLKIWNAETGLFEITISDTCHGGHYIFKNLDGHTKILYRENDHFHIWDVATHDIEISAQIEDIHRLPNADQVLWIYKSKLIFSQYIIDFDTGTKKDFDVYGITKFSQVNDSNGKALLLGYWGPYYNTILVWDLETLTILQNISRVKEISRTQALYVSASDVFVDKHGNAKLIIIQGCDTFDYRFHILNIYTGEKEASFGKSIRCTTFKVFVGKCGKKKVVTGEDIPRIWDIDTGNCDFVFDNSPISRITDIDTMNDENGHTTQIVFYNYEKDFVEQLVICDIN
jgi:hypothetical protein